MNLVQYLGESTQSKVYPPLNERNNTTVVKLVGSESDGESKAEEKKMISSSSAVKWKLSPSSSNSYCLHLNRSFSSPYSRCTSLVKFPTRRFASLSTLVQSDNNNNIISSESDHYTSTVGSSPFPINHTINVTQRHIFILNILASAVAISTTWLFLSTIPTLLAFKRAAESLEKLMDVATEELPDTMAALRLSGMEISDLTMELTDLGQEITKGVRKSTRTVRMAEERLTSLTNMASSGCNKFDNN